jgi:hypothetical protein
MGRSGLGYKTQGVPSPAEGLLASEKGKRRTEVTTLNRMAQLNG